MAAAPAIIAGLSLVYGVASGEQQRADQRQGRRQQERAQEAAQDQTVRSAREAEQNENRARQRNPDVDVLLGDATSANRRGPTTLDADRLLLGRPGLLGA